MSCGSSETDKNALAVIPRGRPLDSMVVMTVTPVAKHPQAARNSTADGSSDSPL